MELVKVEGKWTKMRRIFSSSELVFHALPASSEVTAQLLVSLYQWTV